MKKILTSLIVLFMVSVLPAQKIIRDGDSVKIFSLFKGYAGAFVLYDNQAKKYFRVNKTRCSERFSPASTFKIPNSLIGLESGVIKDENFVIKWDGVKRWNNEWNKNHTLATAIKYSVVPYYQELARRVGLKSMENYLTSLNYGNMSVGEKVDIFWLDNSLKISADEQVEFLKRLYDYKIPFSKRNIDLVKKIMLEEKYSKSILKFKTGTGTREDNTSLGWLVGYVEKGTNVYFYAFNIEAKTFDEVRSLRDDISRKILKELKVIE